MNASTRRSLLIAGAALATLGLAACESGRVSTTTSTGTDRSRLVGEARTALQSLYQQQPAAERLADSARAVLVFPSITQAGLGVGGLYGNGVMFSNGEPVGYYNIAGGTLGFQIGAQSFSQAYFFNSEQALADFRETRGFELGAGVTAVAADFGAGGEVSTRTLQEPLVVATWGQSGLMAGITVEGAKITELGS